MKKTRQQSNKKGGQTQKSRTASFKKSGGGGLVTGRIDGNSRGFAFLLTEKGDLYISKDKLKGARHGDTVRAVRCGDQAEVKEILARGTTSLVGTYFESGKCGYVVADDNHFATIPVRTGKNKTGEKVVIAITDEGEGKVIETLGGADDEGVDLKSIIRSFDLNERYPKSVLKEAEKLENVKESDAKGREDFRSELTFTIDGEDSRDFDDAVSIKKITGSGGGYILTVHIADVAHYVAAASPLDREAFKRGTSVYFPFTTLPMLPDRLSEDLCCLKEGEDRLTLSVIMHISLKGEVKKHKITEGIINCAKRLTYQQAAQILDEDKSGSLLKDNKKLATSLKHMHDLCLILLDRRRTRGAIDFESDEPKITMEDGKVTNVEKTVRLVSHRMIEEFMILTNQTVAAHFFESKIPFIYRGHAAPPEEKLERLEQFLGTLGLKFSYGLLEEGSIGRLDFPVAIGDPAPADFAALLESVPADLKEVVSAVALRSMTKAVYEPVSKGHYGLALMRYCHFTAPIRRYPDLFIHRIIKAQLKGEDVKKYRARVEDVSKQSSFTERQAEEASRRINDLLIAKFMARFIGEEFDGIVSGVTKWGIFVKLSNTAEGLIRAEKLKGEYIFDERSMTLKGEDMFRMGQKIRVKLIEVAGDRIEFLHVSQ